MAEAVATRRDLLGIFILAVSAVAGLAVVPSAAWARPGDPCTGAIIGFLLTLVALSACRVLRWPRFERRWLAVFLAAMPLVYIRSGMLQALPLGLEWVGLGLFLLLALGGLFVSPWFLVAGLFAHGLTWDLWHLRAGGVVPTWYALACAIVDVGLGAYVATRVPVLARG
jgi:hypothetical protein